MPPDPVALQLQAGAAFHAGLLARSLGLLPWDRDDARQDIALDLWQRLGRYDPDRAGLPTFLGLVARNRRHKLGRRLRRDRQRRRQEVSLGTPVGSPVDALTLADTLADCGSASDPDIAADLLRVTARLPEPLQNLCRALDGNGPEAARRACGLTNGVFYRRLATLRLLFRSHGLAPVGGIARPVSR